MGWMNYKQFKAVGERVDRTQHDLIQALIQPAIDQRWIKEELNIYGDDPSTFDLEYMLKTLYEFYLPVNEPLAVALRTLWDASQISPISGMFSTIFRKKATNKAHKKHFNRVFALTASAAIHFADGNGAIRGFAFPYDDSDRAERYYTQAARAIAILEALRLKIAEFDGELEMIGKVEADEAGQLILCALGSVN